MSATEATALLAEAGEQAVAGTSRRTEVIGLLRGADVLKWMMVHDETPRAG